MSVILFIVGIFIGSFLNVIIDRLPRNESFLKGRSHCDKCRHGLAWYDLFPLLSFIQLKGKCRYCHTRLSFYYPAMEIVTGILFFFIPLALPYSSSLGIIYITIIYYLFIISCLIVIFFIDLRHYIIPFPVILPAIIVTFIYVLFVQSSQTLTHLASAIGAGLFFFLLFAGTKGRGMGFGDVVFAFFMGLFLGFPKIVLGLYIAFLTGAIISLILIILKRKKLSGGVIPFGPFLVIAMYISIFLGEYLVSVSIHFLHLK